jgi:hypothetical protein
LGAGRLGVKQGGSREIGQKKWEMGDLDPKREQEQGDWENMREHLFGSREIGWKKVGDGRFRPPLGGLLSPAPTSF